MRDIIKKSMLIGLGAASVAHEEAKKYLAKAVKAGKIDKKFQKTAELMITQIQNTTTAASKKAEKDILAALKKTKQLAGKDLAIVKNKLSATLKNLEKRGANTMIQKKKSKTSSKKK